MFDYIWSEGVIHHTPSSFQTFKMLDSLLTKRGSIYIYVYPKFKFNPYFIIRDLLWKPYLLPLHILYGLSWVLAIPLYGLILLRKLLTGKNGRHKLSSIIFGLFDSLSPEFLHRHTKEEVINWFASCKYKKVKIIGDIGAVGIKDN